ncbi:MAG: sugar phosphate isomerase/epimerase family protein [Oceanipulchritudo sp.]
MKIIGSTSAWKNDLDHALGRLKALGFEEVDLIVIESWGLVSLRRLVDDFDAECGRVEALLDKHGLRAVSVNAAFEAVFHEPGDAESREALRVQVDALGRFMQQLGISTGAHYPGHIADWKNDPEGVWVNTTESLRFIQEYLSGTGLRLGPELHFKTPYETPEGGRRLLRAIPGIPYTYEPSHYIVNGVDVRDTADLLDGACHVHLRGCAPGRLQAPPEVGEDSLRWVVERLKARCYEGMVSIEYLPNADFDAEAAIAGLNSKTLQWSLA